jgi:hypothetical protein
MAQQLSSELTMFIWLKGEIELIALFNITLDSSLKLFKYYKRLMDFTNFRPV